jgi:hypothetical protein
MSLEQTGDFVVLRRILRTVDSGYVLYTNSTLSSGESELDVDRHSLVIADATPPEIAIPIVLFRIGHIVARNEIELDEETERGLAAIMGRRDRKAIAWAFETLMLFWPNTPAVSAKASLKAMSKSSFQWLQAMGRSAALE